MDTALLTSDDFWADETTALAGEPALAGHVLFETSGSSGSPKQVAISKQALLVSAATVNNHLAVNRDSNWGLALPLTHVGGFGVAARAWQAGCAFSQFSSRWKAVAFHDWVAREEITHTSLVPTQVHDLVTAELAAPPSLTAIVVGGGHLDQQIGRAARRLGWPLLASYGMTEAASQIATQGLNALDQPYQSAPIPLLPIWQAKVSEDGLLCISGQALFSGHLEDGNYFPRRSEWHHTADRALLAGDFITPLGRADTMVKILGELVDPEAIERELITISGGLLTAGSFAIVAVPDARAENALFPILDPSVDPELFEKTLADYNLKSPGFRKLPAAIQTALLPRTALGKIRRTELAEFLRYSFKLSSQP